MRLRHTVTGTARAERRCGCRRPGFFVEHRGSDKDEAAGGYDGTTIVFTDRYFLSLAVPARDILRVELSRDADVHAFADVEGAGFDPQRVIGLSGSSDQALAPPIA